MGFLQHRRKAFRGGSIDETNLVAWYKADGDVYNTGTTQATDGQTVETWVDATGNGNDVVGTTPSWPTFETSELNGLPGIQFATTDWMEIDTGVVTAAPMSVYCVAEQDDDTGSYALVHLVDKSSLNNWFALVTRGGDAGDLIEWWSRDSSAFARTKTTTGFSTGVPFLATGIETSTTDRDVWIDGGSTANDTTSVTPSGIDRLAIGALRDGSPGAWLVGRIYEILIYNVAHNATQRQNAEAYLNAKWGL